MKIVENTYVLPILATNQKRQKRKTEVSSNSFENKTSSSQQKRGNPTDPFIISEPIDQKIGEF